MERIYRGYKSFSIYHLTSPVLTRFIENIKTQSELELSTVMTLFVSCYVLLFVLHKAYPGQKDHHQMRHVDMRLHLFGTTYLRFTDNSNQTRTIIMIGT